MRALALQQAGLLTTAAVFVFLGLVVAGFL
jgi:hypothetical protein